MLAGFLVATCLGARPALGRTAVGPVPLAWGDIFGAACAHVLCDQGGFYQKPACSVVACTMIAFRVSPLSSLFAGYQFEFVCQQLMKLTFSERSDPTVWSPVYVAVPLWSCTGVRKRSWGQAMVLILRASCFIVPIYGQGCTRGHLPRPPC